MKDLDKGFRETAYGIAEDTNRYWRDILRLKIGQVLSEEMIDGLYDFSQEVIDEYLKPDE